MVDGEALRPFFASATIAPIFVFIPATSFAARLSRPVTIPSWRICWYAPLNDFAPSWWRTVMPSRPSARDSPFGSYAMTTRSGRYAAIASTFGVKPESAVFGALFGKSDWSSTATTCGPAPIAKSVSVAVGDSETMRRGRFVTVTLPFEPMTRDRELAAADGAAGRAGDGERQSGCRRTGEDEKRAKHLNPPFLEGIWVMGSTTGLLTRGSLPRRLPGSRQWLRGGGATPLTAAGPSRTRTGFPHRAP